MKKVKYLGVVLLVMLCLTGCGKDSKKEESNTNSNTDTNTSSNASGNVEYIGTKAEENADLDGAFANMKNITSFNMKTTMEMEMAGMAYTVELAGDFIATNETAHYTMNTSQLGQQTAMEVYTVVKDGKLYTYMTMDGGNNWIVTEGESDYDDGTVGEFSEVSETASEYESVIEVKSDIPGTKKYEITISKDALNEESSDETLIANDMVMYVYTKDGYVSRITADLGNVFNGGEELAITKYVMTFDISNYNNVSEIVVPEDVVKKAVHMDTEG